LLSFALIVGLPSAGVDHKNTTVGFQGIYPHKGICAFLTLGFLPAAFFYKFQGVAAKLKRSMYILLLATLTIGTMARTAWFMLALILGFMALVKYLYKLKPVERVLVTAFLPAFIAVGSLVVYLNEAVILKALGKDPTFSGRTAIWAVAFLAIIKQPIIGFGYSAFWSVNNPEAFRLALAAGDPHLSNAENGVLQMWLELGLVGVLLVMFMLVRTTRNALACLKSDTPNYALWYMTILFITLLSLIDGDKFMLPTALEWVMFIMADIGLANEARRVRATRTAWA
jgi:exopolysaccharide production protein ExoQ